VKTLDLPGTSDAIAHSIFDNHLEDIMDPITHSPSSNASGNFSQARRDGASALDNASDAASKMASGAKASVAEFAGNAADSFKSAVEDQKSSGANAIGDVARAAKGAADNFQERAPEIANTVRNVATRVEGISNDIRDRSMNELMNSVTDFAAQKPIAFFGCGILAGLVVSRLLSTSNR
jgi:hypothetical protein